MSRDRHCINARADTLDTFRGCHVQTYCWSSPIHYLVLTVARRKTHVSITCTADNIGYVVAKGMSVAKLLHARLFFLRSKLGSDIKPTDRPNLSQIQSDPRCH